MLTITNITDLADVGVYTITSTAIIPQNAFSTNTVLTTNYSLTLTVQSDCLNTVITDRTILAMTNKVSLAPVIQDISFLDSIATGLSIPAHCGARNYSLLPTHSFLTISGTTMSLATSTVADVGEYPINLTVSLTNYTDVASITKSFTVTITCEVQTLNIWTAPAASTTV